MSWVTIAVRLTRDDPTLRYLYRYASTKDGVTTRQLSTTKDAARSGWFAESAAKRLIKQLEKDGVYSASIWARSS